MKKNYICTLLLAIIAIFSTMKAQAQEFHFMPKVGFSLATLMGLDGSARSGANVGVSGEYIFPDDMFAVEAGVYYSMQGATKNIIMEGNTSPLISTTITLTSRSMRKHTSIKV